MIKIHAASTGLIAESPDGLRALPQGLGFDLIFTAADPLAMLQSAVETAVPYEPTGSARLPLIQSQEVWAAGVTYLRSRTARREESQATGGGTFYDRVYEAERPEIFFKATPHRVAAPGGGVCIRSDSKWNVPEPELTLAINQAGRIFGYTIGNDMSSRDIEGENLLYLPQAKVFDRCAALGPCLVVTSESPGPDTTVALEIRRGGEAVFNGDTNIGQIKRPLPSLADWLYRDNVFPHGCYLMTGTGIVPPDHFTLQSGDVIRITIPAIGVLENYVV